MKTILCIITPFQHQNNFQFSILRLLIILIIVIYIFCIFKLYKLFRNRKYILNKYFLYFITLYYNIFTDVLDFKAK